MVKKVGSTQVKLAVATGENPASVEYALRNVTDATFLGADGLPAPTAVFRTASEWGTVTVKGLVPATAYELRAQARNKEGVETALSDPALVTTDP